MPLIVVLVDVLIVGIQGAVIQIQVRVGIGRALPCIGN